MMTTIAFELLPEEFIEFNIYLRLGSPAAKQKIRNTMMRMGFIILGVFAFVVFINDTDPTTLITYGGMFMAFIAYIIFIYPKRIKASLKTQVLAEMSNLENQLLMAKREYTFSESGIGISTTLFNAFYKWETVIKKVETPKSYLLFISSMQAFIIPKRVFKTESESKAFESILGQHLSFRADVGHAIPD